MGFLMPERLGFLDGFLLTSFASSPPTPLQWALMDAPNRRVTMEGNIRTFANPDANERIYEALMSIL